MDKIKDDLIEILAQYFWQYKSYEVDAVLKGYDLEPDESLNPHDSKKIYARSAMIKLSQEELIKLAERISKEEKSVSLNKQLENYLGDRVFEITYITRRKLVDYFAACPNLEGKVKLDELLRGIWNVDIFYEDEMDLFGLNRETVGEFLVKNVIIENNISYKDMLLEYLDFKYISDEAVIKFLEKVVNPEVRTGVEQEQYVAGINEIIEVDGFELVVSGKISNESIYKIVKRNTTQNNMKNLIFAPLNKKPDIVIDDAIDNELKIVGDTGDCLFYNFEPNADGLTWNTLVNWWATATKSTNDNVKRELFMRLRDSLDSQPEKDFMALYYKLYENRKDFPALIPQVYLHYDPHAKKWRGSGVVYTHQRMDFLMLLRNGVRVIIEIDGKQHYAEGDKASPKLYAEMVKDTRELQLKGYDIYRFGGDEFVDKVKAKKIIQDFFEALFSKYEI